MKECENFSKEFDISIQDVIVFSYNWYNGGDEPIFFNENKDK